MARLTLTTFLTLDGVMQAPGAPQEDVSGDFPYGGWLAPFADEESGRYLAVVLERAQAFLLGRRTYEIFASYWPQVTDPADPIAARLNGRPKYVASHTLAEARWGPGTVLGGDVPAEVARLKERLGPEGELQVHGSGALARSLMAHDLIDEYRLLVFPVVLGRGVRLFPDGGLPTAFELTSATATGAGVTIQTYRPTGRAAFGDLSVR
ncbi:dihydrofolate reductase family protein [Streptomyces sp. NRRL S-350]|uniref:dihydrofolate reductase family protein n=1 Tax=Streptomyces sp. NRRL S-350 TaxID=1463902 RepID=UPI0004C08A52|nr:dihydrofolate reductase family protein [Streptomyces sp. NRRL S-350]